MRDFIAALAIGLALVGPSTALAVDPSASLPASPAGRWQGTASEVPGIYSGPVTAKVTLDLKPDGTFVETWKQGNREWTTSGTWRADGKRVVLESRDRSHARLTLRRAGDELYTVAVEPMPDGRATTVSIDLHPAP
jgi:hypothetical protein